MSVSLVLLISGNGLSVGTPTPPELCRLPGWRDGVFKFTGFREDYSRMYLHGEIVWSGVATFHTGRRERVWYYTALRVDRIDLGGVGNAVTILEYKLAEASIKAGELAAAGDRGLLLNWWRRKCRVAISVEWQHFDDADPIEDQMNGIKERGQPSQP